MPAGIREKSEICIKDGACVKRTRRLLFCAEFPEPPVKRGLRQTDGPQRVVQRELTALPGRYDLGEIGRYGPAGPAEPDAPGLGGGDALRLPPVDGLPLRLGHEGQDLQHQVGDEGAQQVLALPRVQQRHIQHADVCAHLPGEDAPLLLQLLIAAAQPVDAQDIQQITAAQPAQQLLVLGALKVLAGLTVNIQIFCRDRLGRQRNALTVLVLVGGADPNVTVDVSCQNDHSFS